MALNLAIAESTKGYRSARLEAVGRLACNKVDGTGRRILSEKCSLRPLQNFQPLHIQGRSLGHHAVWQGNLIKIHADRRAGRERAVIETHAADRIDRRSEEHTSELQSLMRNSYAVFCLKKTNTQHHI